MISFAPEDTQHPLHVLRITSHAARGLLQSQQLVRPGAKSAALPPALLTAMHLYSKRLALMGRPDEVGPEAFYRALRQPCASWFPEAESLFAPDACLVEEDGRLGDVVTELNFQGSDIDVTLTEAPMKEFLDSCREKAKTDPKAAQAAYVAYRELVTTRQVMTLHQFYDALEDPAIPPEVIQRTWSEEVVAEPDGMISLCGACGCVLTPTRDGFRCHSAICVIRTDNFKRFTRIPYQPGMRALSVGMAKCVAAPGKHEIALARWLRQEFGLQPVLWPGVDTYDLGAAVGGIRMAVDLKDHANPGLLGLSLRPFRPVPPFDEAYIVVPDDRVQRHPGYMRSLTRFAKPEVLANGIRFLKVSEFKNLVRDRVGGIPVA